MSKKSISSDSKNHASDDDSEYGDKPRSTSQAAATNEKFNGNNSTYRANELSSRGAKSSSMGVSLAKFSEVMKVKPKKESQVHLDMIEVEARVKMMLDQRLGTL